MTGEEGAEARDLSLAGGRHLSEEVGLPLPPGSQSSQGGTDHTQLPGDEGTEADWQTGIHPGDRCFRTVIVTSCRNKIQDRINCSEEKQW